MNLIHVSLEDSCQVALAVVSEAILAMEPLVVYCVASQKGIFEMALELGAPFEHHQAGLEVVSVPAALTIIRRWSGGDLRAGLGDGGSV